VKKRRPMWMTKMYLRFPSNENILSRHPDAFLAATNCAMQVIHRRAAQGALMTVGFYKRGCQVKTLLLSREGGIFFGHPAPARSSTNSLRSAARLSECIGHLRDHVSCVLSRGIIAPLSSVMAIANHGSI
jgi:hypothetical protein